MQNLHSSVHRGQYHLEKTEVGIFKNPHFNLRHHAAASFLRKTLLGIKPTEMNQFLSKMFQCVKKASQVKISKYGIRFESNQRPLLPAL